MRDQWIYSMSIGNEVAYFATVEMSGIIDMDNAYNVVLNTGELFMDKEKVRFGLDKIEYMDSHNSIYIVLERDVPIGAMPVAC